MSRGSAESEIGDLDIALAGRAAVDEVVERILGDCLPGRIDGSRALRQSIVLHVAAVVVVGGERRVLRINEQTPRSAVDYFLLNATRAWADVVVTSGKIVRDEPELSFDLDGPSGVSASALAAARAARTAVPLHVGVLSSGSGLSENLSVWQTEAAFTLITSDGGKQESAQWAAGAGVALQALDPVGPRAAVEWARDSAEPLGNAGEPGSRSNRVSVELGARSSVHLYGNASGEARPLVDVLALSEYDGPVPDPVVGEPFLPGIDLKRLYSPGPATSSGDWRFRMWSRR